MVLSQNAFIWLNFVDTALSFEFLCPTFFFFFKVEIPSSFINLCVSNCMNLFWLLET